MKEFKFVMYPPNSTIPIGNSCYAESEKDIPKDLFVSQLLSIGWKIKSGSITELGSSHKGVADQNKLAVEESKRWQ